MPNPPNSPSDTNVPSTQEPNLQQQLEFLTQQLEQAQKMTALGELVSTTTHEFNNVLMTIINYAKMGLRHTDQATREKSFTKILAAGQRAAKITNSVLGFARNRSDSYEPTDLARVIEDSLVLLEREMNKYRIAVECEIQQVPLAIANGNQIQQVLLNLLINARQAMLQGGRLIIRLSYDETNGTVDLMVRDTGCGIEREKLPKIFDSFYSTKQGPDASGKGGTGLGLSMCRNIIESHQGKIRVQSTVGKGTAFTLKIPAVQQQVEKNLNPTSTESTPTGVCSASTIGLNHMSANHPPISISGNDMASS